MNNIHDILESKPGDTLFVEGDIGSIVDNLIEFEKWAIVGKHPDGYCVCKIMNYPDGPEPSLRISELAELYGMSDNLGDNHTHIKVPNGVKPESFRAYLYRHCKRNVSFKIFENYIILERKNNSHTDVINQLKSRDEYFCSVDSIENMTKFVSGLHREARKENIKIGTKREGSKIKVFVKKDKQLKRDNTRVNSVIQWFKNIEYNKPYLVNDINLKGLDIAYIMTVLSKYGYDYKNSGHLITKRHYSLKRNHGKVILSVDGKIVHTFDVASVRGMTDKMWSMVDMLLMPYGYKRYD